MVAVSINSTIPKNSDMDREEVGGFFQSLTEFPLIPLFRRIATTTLNFGSEITLMVVSINSTIPKNSDTLDELEAMLVEKWFPLIPLFRRIATGYKQPDYGLSEYQFPLIPLFRRIATIVGLLPSDWRMVVSINSTIPKNSDTHAVDQSIINSTDVSINSTIPKNSDTVQDTTEASYSSRFH